MAIERTFSIVKPDSVAKNNIGGIVAKLEEGGLRVIASRMVRLTEAQAREFYAVHKERPFYKDLVAFAKKHEILVLSDLAYAEVYFDNNPPPSLLQVPGANDVAVEFTSMSKTFSMPGWRIGFAVGNERVIAALGRVKSYLDYGAFTPVQVAAARLITAGREIRAAIRSRLDRNLESLRNTLAAQPSIALLEPEAGWSAVLRVPATASEESLVLRLLQDAHVLVHPGYFFDFAHEAFVVVSLLPEPADFDAFWRSFFFRLSSAFCWFSTASFTWRCGSCSSCGCCGCCGLSLG